MKYSIYETLDMHFHLVCPQCIRMSAYTTEGLWIVSSYFKGFCFQWGWKTTLYIPMNLEHVVELVDWGGNRECIYLDTTKPHLVQSHLQQCLLNFICPANHPGHVLRLPWWLQGSGCCLNAFGTPSILGCFTSWSLIWKHACNTQTKGCSKAVLLLLKWRFSSF